jgi:hypothetical protein
MKKILIGYFAGLTLVNIYYIVEDHKKLNEYKFDRHTNKGLIESGSTSDALFRIDKKRSNECITKESK